MSGGAIRLAIAGCGVMGRRHVLGLGRLRAVGRVPFRLVAVCDPVGASAEAMADLAETTLGERPAALPGLADALATVAPRAVSVTTAPALHPAVAVPALAAGLDVMVEKPIALTVGGGREIVAAARAAGRVLAVAENYRRDPVNRLAKALVGAGAVGRPHLATQWSSAWGERVVITPWRHRRAAGGIAVDMGVHYADILEDLLGPAESLAGMGAVVDVERLGADGTRHPADAEDLTVGVIRFASGALASWTLDLAGRGEEAFRRVVHGSGGSLEVPMDRTGAPLRLVRWQGGSPVPVAPEEILGLVPGFALDPVTADLFGGERLASYRLPWAETDANLLAVEYADFARAIATGTPPEVDGAQGLRSLAIAYGLLESDRTGRRLRVDDLVAGSDSPYQAEIDAGG